MLTRLLLIAALLLPAAAFADEDRQEVADRIRMVRVYMLTEALDLNEATAAKLFPYLRDADGAVEELQQRKRTARKGLRAMVEAEAFEAKAVDKLVEELTEVDVALSQARAERVRGLKAILTPEQRAKYLLVQSKFEERVRSLIRDERQERRQRRERRERELKQD